MSKPNRTEQGITIRHSRGCRREPCTCTPTFMVQVWDARADKRITRTFTTITAARRWRQDAYAALRGGTLSADRGPTLPQGGHHARRAGPSRASSLC